MESFVIARVLHVLGVVLWIGGVAMVTTVLLPAVRRMTEPEDRVRFFEEVERRFAGQARVTTLLTGLTGLYLVYRMDAWRWFLEPERWYLHGMVAIWALFTLLLFVLEPLFLHRLFLERARHDPEGTFRFIQIMHIALLSLSLIALLGGVAGAHGWLFFV